MSTCALCLKDIELIKSHIFPEFLYKPLYDPNHQYLVVSTNRDTPIRRRPKGIYGRLLCHECDNNIIGSYEDYASTVMFENVKEKEIVENGFLFRGLNYRIFKLFQLSLLWRASISNRPEVPKINLGPHQERIRKMLYYGNPGKPYEYGCGLFFLPQQPKEMLSFIYPPEPVNGRVMGHFGFRAIFAGLFWFWISSNHMEMFSRPKIFLSENGDLPVKNSGKKGWNFITGLAGEMTKK